MCKTLVFKEVYCQFYKIDTTIYETKKPQNSLFKD